MDMLFEGRNLISHSWPGTECVCVEWVDKGITGRMEFSTYTELLARELKVTKLLVL